MKLLDYFNIEYGQREYHCKRDLEAGETPLISSKGTDRGIYGFFDIEPKFKHVISVPSTGSVCEAFYQGYECCIDDNCLVLSPKQPLSVGEMIYFAIWARKQKFRHVYGRQVTPDRLGNLEVGVVPEWVYLTTMPNCDDIFQPLISESKVDLKSRRWKQFEYNDIFDIKKGKRVTKKDLKSGTTPYITSIATNNGITDYIDVPPNHKGNTITINYDGSVGEAYYQQQDFYALDSVNVLYPKNFTLNQYIAMFLITLMKKEKFKYNYGRKWHLARMRTTNIMLPVKEDDMPDWDFMEAYIKSMPYSKRI